MLYKLIIYIGKLKNFKNKLTSKYDSKNNNIIAKKF